MIDITSETLFGVEYEPEYSEIESILSQLDESADPLSNAYIPPKINWHHISEMSKKLLDQCFDLRVTVWSIRAGMHINGIFTLYESMTHLLHRVQEENAIIYPRSEEPPYNSGHAAALGWLATRQCVSEMKLMRLTPEHSFTLQDLIITESNTGNHEQQTASSSTALLAVNDYFQKNGKPKLIEQLTSVDESLNEISCFANQCSESYQLNCDLFHKFLKNVISQLNLISEVDNPQPDDSENMKSDEWGGDGYDRTNLISNNQRVKSRQEVIMMLDRILEYFRYCEPSHPAPMFICRTKEMIGMDFYSIVEEILPESIATLKQLAGKNNLKIQ